jgi:hypothetical protein
MVCEHNMLAITHIILTVSTIIRLMIQAGSRLKRHAHHLIRIVPPCLAAFSLGLAAPSHADCVKLSQLDQIAKPQVIYLWSPRMVSSVIEAHHAQQAALQSSARFIAALDPRVEIEEARAALMTQGNAAKVLSATHALCADSWPEHALDHAPTMYVMSQGKLHPHRIIGVMPRSAWAQAIQQRLKDLHHAP